MKRFTGELTTYKIEGHMGADSIGLGGNVTSVAEATITLNLSATSSNGPSLIETRMVNEYRERTRRWL